MAKTTDGAGARERIDEVKKKLEKQFGKGTLMGATEKPRHHEVISTGSIGLDKALGINGLPKGRIIEIYGPESSGKTTLVIETMAQAHRENKTAQCAFIDAEHAFDTKYAEALGVDLDRLDISQPNNGDEALEIAKQLLQSGEYAVVAIDSVAALTPKSEMEGEIGDSTMGKHARLMSQGMRMLTGPTATSGAILIFINQLRDKIGVMFGSPETTTGGNALKFYASVRLDVRRSVTKENSIIENGEKMGNLTTVKVVKNKCAPPFKQCQFNILYGQGIDTMTEVLDAAMDAGIITKAGASYSYGEQKLGVGKETVRQLLKDNTGFYEELKDKVMTLEAKAFVPTVEEAANGE